ncbi:MAG: STAS/SEC14 domain-containing protein, partial [Betaproteobacteria bacterium]
MFNVTPNGPDRVDIEIRGKLNADEMKRALDDLSSKTKGISHGKMLYRIDEMAMPSLGAIGVELSRLPELFRLIGRFDRVAVLADQGWIRKASELEGALIPGLQIKA